jgi:hypothetical protein
VQRLTNKDELNKPFSEGITSMKPSTKTIAALAAVPLTLLIATATFAADENQRPNYTYVELDYVYGGVDIESDDLPDSINEDTFHISKGLALKGSVVLVEQLLLRASYYGGDGTWKDSLDVDVTSGVASVGWLAPTTDATGIDISLDYRKDDIDIKQKSSGDKGDEDISGAGISFGVRAAPTKSTEIGARVGWYEGDWDGAIGFSLNFAWNFSDRWGINASWDRIDSDVDGDKLDNYELNQYAIGGRFYF